jgi:hypothetical protein
MCFNFSFEFYFLLFSFAIVSMINKFFISYLFFGMNCCEFKLLLMECVNCGWLEEVCD